ncbi:MAG: hypothetical protein NDJ89_01380 [Oligoflexia bacterium]|nr:hypothetical protein [Oligoflexia bacterium]
MQAQLESSVALLEGWRATATETFTPSIDREAVVAHATLSALIHHWPSKSSPQIEDLLAQTIRIKEVERSRWMTQRRIAIAKLVRFFDMISTS